MVVCVTNKSNNPAMLRHEPQMVNQAVDFFFSRSSNFCDQMRETVSFGNIFELYMEKTISVFCR